MSYDEQCEKLAKHFLHDHPHAKPLDDVPELAQIIQDAVEDFMRKVDRLEAL